jgi:hypothetical protein
MRQSCEMPSVCQPSTRRRSCFAPDRPLRAGRDQDSEAAGATRLPAKLSFRCGLPGEFLRFGPGLPFDWRRGLIDGKPVQKRFGVVSAPRPQRAAAAGLGSRAEPQPGRSYSMRILAGGCEPAPARRATTPPMRVHHPREHTRRAGPSTAAGSVAHDTTGADRHPIVTRGWCSAVRQCRSRVSYRCSADA